MDPEVLEKIIAAGELVEDDTVFEIGAGAGTLTVDLAKKVKRVIALENDKRLIKPLSLAVRDLKSVEVINEDFLKFDLSKKISNTTSYKVVADIPYYITGEIIKRLFALPHKPSLIVLLVQQEVAERITAGPGKTSIMSIATQLYSDPEIIFKVPASAFFPSPEVESAVIKLRVSKQIKIMVEEEKFFRLLRIGFSARRKTLLNNLSAGFKLSKEKTAEQLKNAGIGENTRAQELTLEEWNRIYKILLPYLTK